MKRIVICLIVFLAGHMVESMAQDNSTGVSSHNTASTLSKGNLDGTVVNEKDEPLEFVNVALLAKDSIFMQGTCTKADGTFAFTGIATGKYLLQLSYMGYRSTCSPCSTGTTTRWTLLPDAIVLNEAVVTAQRPLYKLQNGILETNVSQSLLSTLSNAGEILKQIPGIRLTEDGYTVFGKGTPVIYINNRRLQNLSELDRLSAGDIKKVELITNPGAEYDADVKAVVRIYTLSKEKGVNPDLRTGIIQGRRTTHYEQINMNYNKGGLLLSGMLYYNHNASKRGQNTQYEIPSSSTL